MRTVRTLLAMALLLLLVSSCCSAQNKTLTVRPLADAPAIAKRALVIGISNYRHANALPETINDANRIKQLLQTRFGFPEDAITFMTDAPGTKEELLPTYTNLVAAFDALLNGLDKESEVVVFFSGHGTRFDNHDYLVPQDGLIGNVKATCLDYDEFRSKLTSKSPARALLIVDACRSVTGKGAEAGLGEAGVDLGPQIAELLSCRASELSQVGKPEDFHESVFTHYLLQGLEGDAEAGTSSGEITFDSLERYVKRQVSRYVSSRYQDSQNPIGHTTSGAMVLARVGAVKLTSKAEKMPVAQGNLRRNPKDGAQLVWIPSGEFAMGDNDRIDNPVHHVMLDGYYIYKYPVTVGQYEMFCRDTNRQMPPAPDFNPAWSKKDHPIVNVSWIDAQAYCQWAGVSLPTEAQWEKAARGPENFRFPWGDTFDGTKLWNSNARDNIPSTVDGTASVTRTEKVFANAYGCVDMAGNVWQWCLDMYDKNYWSTATRYNNPVNLEGTMRVARGGPWRSNFGTVIYRTSFREQRGQASYGFTLGFRCVLPAGSN
jgi:formylglycine-generating enzyme required for sulfatase activity